MDRTSNSDQTLSIKSRPVSLQIQVSAITRYMAGMSTIDALTVINNVMKTLLSQGKHDIEGLSVYASNPLLEEPGPLTKIDRDPELRDFILSINQRYTKADIVRLCVEKFGKDRAPSYSGLSRFVRNMTFRKGRCR